MPDMSVVVVSLVGGSGLIAFLSCLDTGRAEHLVLVRGERDSISDLQEQFPSIRFMDMGELSVPGARQHGVDHATGEFVALLEDTSRPAPGWYDAVESSFADSGVVAVGGPVVLSGSLDSRYLALGCVEYGRFHPAMIHRLATEDSGGEKLLPVSRLPGNNLAYRRETLLGVMGKQRDGLIEGEVNGRLVEAGYVLHLHPTMQVEYAGRDQHGAKLATRFSHGRLFAGNRVAGKSMGERLAWFTKSLLLPVVLTVRGWSSMKTAVASAAWLPVMVRVFMMETAWALGESAGYLVGAGNSLEAWR